MAPGTPALAFPQLKFAPFNVWILPLEVAVLFYLHLYFYFIYFYVYIVLFTTLNTVADNNSLPPFQITDNVSYFNYSEH